MSIEETAKVVAYLREFFPQGASITENTVRAWHDMIGMYPYPVAWHAAKIVARTWDGYMMPPPRKVIDSIKTLMPDDNTIPMELWNITDKCIRRGSVISQMEFESLPEPIKTYYRSISAFREMAMWSLEEKKWERTRFLKDIPRVIEECESRAVLPADIRQMLEEGFKQIEG